MATQTQEAKERYVFRGTNNHKGRKIAITPENSSMKHLEYGRIILDSEVSSAEFESGIREIGLICLSGECSIDVGGEISQITQHDSIIKVVIASVLPISDYNKITKGNRSSNRLGVHPNRSWRSIDGSKITRRKTGWSI